MSRWISILVTFILSVSVGLAYADNGTFISGGPATQQQFQGNDTTRQLAPHQSSSVATTQPSHNVVQQTTTPSAGSSATPNTAPSTTPTTTDNTVLQQQLQRLNQNTLMFQQRTDQRVEALTTVNQQLQDQIKALTQSLAAMNQELAQFKQAQARNHANQPAALAWLQRYDQQLSLGMKLLIIGVLVFVALIIGILMPRRKQVVYASAPVTNEVREPQVERQAEPSAQVASAPAADVIVESVAASEAPVAEKPAELQAAQTASASDDDDTDSEYDFMNSVEAIPAKLDLARAYIAMEDYKAARDALEQVIAGGDEQQQQEARELLETIPAEV